MKHFTSAHYRMHRAALLPVLSGNLSLSELALPSDQKHFADFLYRQRLHACWLRLAEQQNLPDGCDELVKALKSYTLISTARELPQQRVLQEVSDLFRSLEIEWFAAKGSQLRKVIYEDAYLRPAIDIDVFVREPDRKRATEALVKHGFVARPLPETLSHELKLTRNKVDVDLHWHLFRPGRAREGLMDWLFEHRQEFNGYPGLDDTASLFVMLVHPAITKYLLSPTSMLIHQVDQARLVARDKVDWELLTAELNRSGTRTAAWCSLYVLEGLGGIKAPGGFEKKIRPPGMQRRYLQAWIEKGWIEKWFAKRWLVAGLFSLALQDSPSDALRAVVKRKRGLNSGTP